jgi:alkylation response protein AidB-like acyl-CoA dehydrogenase
MAIADFDVDRFDLDDNFFSLAMLEGYDKKMVRSVKSDWKKQRQFCKEVLKPEVLRIDRENAADHDHISWDLLRLAGRNGQLTNFIPKFLGGDASGSPAIMGPVAEEQAAVDTAYSGMLGGQGLGLVAMMMTFNMRLMQYVAERTVDAAHSDKPYVIDCAITEPTAGTDVEEVDLYPKAKLMCLARRVDGGAMLNGRKVFISTGHMATDHTVLMTYDFKDPLNNYGYFLVPTGSKGFSLGRKEVKMGHRASVISELIFEDCFVPQENIIMDTHEFDDSKYRGQVELLLEMVLGITRTAVGAMGTGNARGSFERALELAMKTKHKGRTIINQQWAQAWLTNMFINVMQARSIYLESTFCLMANMGGGGARAMPGFMNTEFMQRQFKTERVKKYFHSDWLRKRMLDQVLSMKKEARARIQFMSSMAKVVGTDMAMENGHLAVEFMSKAGLRHDAGIEKGFRDAKLLQIFEGTNQLNRLNIFKHAFTRHMDDVEVF